jgi:formylglycine-generating enzyme required for sulfatase activity
VTSVGLALPMTCFGVLPELDAKTSCDPATGALAPEPTLAPGSDAGLPTAGSWAPAARAPCNTDVPPGMICVPGGVLLMGSPRYYAVEADLDPTPEHIVQLHPFALDADEVTVGQVRALVNQSGLTPPIARDPNFDARFGPCTYLDANDASDDAMPANCVSWSTADAACKLLGKRLPTEAEWEYAAGNLGAETPYAWGSDPSICANAVVARGRALLVEPDQCRTIGSTTLPAGPALGGSPNDVTALGIANLSGNLSEWVADLFAAYYSPCWSGAAPLVDPVCAAGSTNPAVHSVRGGAWSDLEYFAGVFYRNATTTDGPLTSTGFRCARSM